MNNMKVSITGITETILLIWLFAVRFYRDYSGQAVCGQAVKNALQTVCKKNLKCNICSQTAFLIETENKKTGYSQSIRNGLL